MKRKLSIAISLVVILTMALTSLALAADPPAQVVFTTDLSCAVSVLVINYTDPNGVVVNFVSGSTPWTLNTLPSTPVSFTYPVPVVCDGVTYNSVSLSPSNPVLSGAAGTTTMVVGQYIPPVSDTTPPTLHLPVNMTVEATSASGAAVTYTATADDANPAHPAVSCVPASGATFGFGIKTVNCSATDAAGNTANGSFTVTVQDTTPPTVTPPANMTVEATGASGAIVTYSGESAVDTVDGSLSATCVPPSGSTFPVGTNTVICSATDSHGNSGSASFHITVTDTTPPVLTLPSDMTVNASSSSGAIVTYTASANDLVDGPVAVTCLPASGSLFALGKTTVNCSATDAHGNPASGSFNVTVVMDTTPPVWTVPADFSVEATGPAGAAVTYSASASDPDDAVNSQSCSPASGDTFPLGTTTVNCTATDTHGNIGTASFHVTVVDTTAPVLTVPSDITVEATSSTGAIVIFSVSANDIVDGSIVPTCVPASGSSFPLGITSVNCSASDAHGNTASASFKVIVADTTAPALTLPGNIIVTALNEFGAPVSFNASANDLVDGPVAVICSPASGSLFPIGTTTVNCWASDSHGNTANGSFNITVQYAAEGTQCKGVAGHQILQPINADGSSVFEQGRTVPARFRVCGADGDPIGTPGVVTNFKLIQIISQGLVTNVDQAVESTPPHDVFRSGNGQWIFDISTKDLVADSTYVYLITLNDGSTIQFQFTLK